MLNSLGTHFTRWKSNGGVELEVENQACEYKTVFFQLRSHFPDDNIESPSHDNAPFSAGQFLHAILTCILHHRISSATGNTVFLA